MRDLTGPDRHRSALDPPRLRTGPPWPESADPSRPCPTATPTPTTKPTTSRRLTSKASAVSPPINIQGGVSRAGGPDTLTRIVSAARYRRAVR